LKVTVINDDYTIRAINCDIQQQFSEIPDGPVTHVAVFWYDDIFNGLDEGNIHIVPIKNILYEVDDLKKQERKTIQNIEFVTYRIPISEELRNKVFDRDGRKCRFCGATEDLCLDHKFPFSKGGKTEENNLQTLCRSCNLKKRANILIEGD